MLFIVRGTMESSYRLLHNNSTSECLLGPGHFCGEELISWCFSKPLRDNLPLSTATLTTRKVTEAFALDAQDLQYITQHFRHKFANEKLKRAVRFYSSSWQTWAAVTIQLAWQRHRARHGLVTSSHSGATAPAIAPDQSMTCDGAAILSQAAINSTSRQQVQRLNLYAAMLCSPKPTDDR